MSSTHRYILFITAYVPASSYRFSSSADGILHLIATTNGQLVLQAEGNYTATDGIGYAALTASIIAEAADTVTHGIAETELSGAATRAGIERIGEVTGTRQRPQQVASGTTLNPQRSACLL